MKNHMTYTLAAFLAFFCLAASAEEPLPKALSPDQEAAALKLAETTGLAIYRHDQAASVATDAAFKLPQFKKDQRLRGWITEEKQGRIVVTFVDQTPAALYRVTVSKDGVAGEATAMAPPVPLTPYESGAAAARKVALTYKFQPCAEKYNSVVLPAPEGSEGNWLVYLLPATPRNDLVPIGGAYRVTVKDSRIVSQRGFTRSCITLQNDENAVGLVVSHLLDPVPTEVHVFWSMWTKKFISVSTPPNGTVWIVEGNKIKLMERKEAKKD